MAQAAKLPHWFEHLRKLRAAGARAAGEVEQAKLAALKELAYGASHEINNPLANIAMRAQALLREERDPGRRHMLATINRQAFRATEMISDMMLFAKPPAPRPSDVHARAAVQGVLAELAQEAAAQGTVLSCTAPEESETHLTADRTQFAVAIRALCRNALEAVACGGRVELTLSATADRLHIEVCDDGPGLTEEVREHLFDPFYSGREAGRGLGFGLSKVWRIVGLHGGTVRAENRPERGARFGIELPRDAAGERAA